MSDLRYAVTVEPLPDADGGGFVAFVPGLPGCMSDGATPEDALANVIDAIGVWIEAAGDIGHEVPRPEDFRGRQSSSKPVTLTQALKDELTRMEEREKKEMLARVEALARVEDLLNRLKGISKDAGPETLLEKLNKIAFAAWKGGELTQREAFASPNMETLEEALMGMIDKFHGDERAAAAQTLLDKIGESKK
jgi:antitoxin HicB